MIIWSPALSKFVTTVVAASPLANSIAAFIQTTIRSFYARPQYACASTAIMFCPYSFFAFLNVALGGHRIGLNQTMSHVRKCARFDKTSKIWSHPWNVSLTFEWFHDNVFQCNIGPWKWRNDKSTYAQIQDGRRRQNCPQAGILTYTDLQIWPASPAVTKSEVES